MKALFNIHILAVLLAIYLSHSPAEFGVSPAYMPEICDNALDDDQDGLIDLQDTDCDCGKIESRIVNPSFENINCCPDDPGQAFCITSWLESTISTPDYYNNCGWNGWDHLPVPRPIPDGNAFVGFRNGRFESEMRPEEKEYIGTCMIVSPLWAGERYHLKFHIGFVDSIHSPPTDLVFYGSGDCDRLPAGQGQPFFGCPANDPAWYALQRIPVRGHQNWKTYEFDLTPTETIFALAIGPDCEAATSKVDLYYFFDNLIVTDEEELRFVILEDGPRCAPDFALELPNSDTLNYQWYLNKIALVGETEYRLYPGGQSGVYQAAVYTSSQCYLSRPFSYDTAPPSERVEAVICNGEPYFFHGRRLDQPGQYMDTLQTAERCDSIVLLTLESRSIDTASLQVNIFEGERFRLGNETFRQPGRYQVRLPNQAGCDSLILLDLDHFEVYIPNVFSPNGDGVNDHFNLFGGPDLLRIQSLRIFDRWGVLVFEGSELPGDATSGWDGRVAGQPASAGIYLFQAILEMEDSSQWPRSGAFSLIR